MDVVLTAALGALPQLGGAGLLFAFVVLLIRREGAELTRARESYTAELTRAQKAHTAELTREREAHDAELRERQIELDALRERCLALDQHLDDERARRRAAEDRMPPQHEERRSPWAG